MNDDELAGVEQKGGDVVMTSSANGDFAITWYDWRDGDPDVYIRLYGGDGEPKGDSFRISALHDSQQLIPAVTGTEDNIIAAWLDDRGGDWDVYARLKSWETLSVAVSISPESLEIEHWKNAKFTVTVENDDAEQDSYNLDVTWLAETPATTDDFVWEMETSITDLPPGEFVELPLEITPAYEQGVCENVPYPFSVTATSVTKPNISSTAEAEFTIKPAPCKTFDVKPVTLTLHKGINVISVPVKVEKEWRMSDLAEHIGKENLAMIIRYDYTQDKFISYLPTFPDASPANAVVQPNEGYIVVMKADKDVEFEGTTVDDETVAPSLMPLTLSSDFQSTSVPSLRSRACFVVTGNVRQAETGRLLRSARNAIALNEVTVKIRNLRTGQTVEDVTGTLAGYGNYVATFVASSAEVMMRPYDKLKITAHDANHRLTIAPIIHTLTPDEMADWTLVMPLRLSLPKQSDLLPNYPNPFNPETWLPYQLADDATVTVSIYNQQGQLVRTIALGYKTAGMYTRKDRAAYWNGRNDVGEKVASGVYFYHLQAGRFAATRRMLIVK